MIVQRITGMINNDDELMKQNWSGKTKRAEVTIVVKRAELNSLGFTITDETFGGPTTKKVSKVYNLASTNPPLLIQPQL